MKKWIYKPAPKQNEDKEVDPADRFSDDIFTVETTDKKEKPTDQE